MQYIKAKFPNSTRSYTYRTEDSVKAGDTVVNAKGAKLICEHGYLDNVDEIFGLHVFTDIDCGKISIEAGPRMAASDKFIIHIKGKAGHAGTPHQCIDALTRANTHKK